MTEAIEPDRFKPCLKCGAVFPKLRCSNCDSDDFEYKNWGPGSDPWAECERCGQQERGAFCGKCKTYFPYDKIAIEAPFSLGTSGCILGIAFVCLAAMFAAFLSDDDDCRCR